MSRSSAKREPWLSDQINIAKKNLAEWPEWMKDVSKLNENVNSSKNGAKAGKSSSNSSAIARKRK
jgi:hypothetical protein